MNLSVCLFGFIRPETTEKVFEQIRKAKPSHLFLCLDAPRGDRPTDGKPNAEVKRIFESVDWPCCVERYYARTNQGCDSFVVQGLTWLFEQTESAVILEDDCVPDSSFFPFCEELLERYADNSQIGMIAGHREHFQPIACSASYYFNRIPITLGWATWRRVWRTFDFKMTLWPEMCKSGLLRNELGRANGKIMERFYDRYYRTHISWDSAWGYTLLHNHQLCIHPRVNLVSNIGFGDGATHCNNVQSPWNACKTSPILFPLQHPTEASIDLNSENLRVSIFKEPSIIQRVCAKIERIIG